MANVSSDSIRDASALPPELALVAPWLAGAALISLAQWSTLPLAAWGFDLRRGWWMPLAIGALLRQAVAPAYLARMARSVRPQVLSFVASRALATGTFESAPASLGPLAQRIGLALEQSFPTLAGGALTTLIFAAMAAYAFPIGWSLAMLLACAGAVALRTRARRWLDASSDAVLDATHTEGAWLQAAARGHWEITGDARERLLIDVGACATRAVAAEHAHRARTRALRTAQLALFIAPLAWLLFTRSRHGAPVSLRDWALVLPALAPALAAMRALDELAIARRALWRFDLAPPPSPPDAPAGDGPIVLDRVTVRYGDHVALSSVTLSVPARGVLAVVGPNGAGKSTLAHVIAGAVAPDEGSCLAGDTPMHRVSPGEVALVPQHPCYIESASVLENIRLAAPSATSDSVSAALSSLGLTIDPSRRASGLSRGEQRRIAIARALLRKPRWLVLDEPDAWLDRAGRDALQRALREAGERCAVVLVTHRADLVGWADRVVVLSAEHTVEAQGAPGDTLSNSPTGRALLASLADESLRFSAG